MITSPAFETANATLSFTIMPLSAALALAATFMLAYFLGRHVKRPLAAVLIAALALPTLMMIAAFYFAITEDVDGPPPGMVLLGALVISGFTTLATLAFSAAAVWLARR